MSIMGKLIGALIGWALFHNPIGIVLGALLGHLWDSSPLRVQRQAPNLPDAFVGPLFSLAGAIAKSDGRVSEAEIAAAESLMARLQLSAHQRTRVILQFNAGKSDAAKLQVTIADLKAWCRGRRDLAYLLLDMLLDVVYAEGPLVPEKLAIVRKLCFALGIHESELMALAAMRGYAYTAPGGSYRSSRPPPQSASYGKDPYAVLGLQRGAHEREIKRAYRKLISQYHPDKLGDVPDELKRRAEERAREINAAYEQLREQRGIK